MIVPAADLEPAARRALASRVTADAYTQVGGARPDLTGLDGPAVVALHDGTPVGVAVVAPYTTGGGSRAWELLALWVDPAMRGRHLARSLLSAAIDAVDAGTMRAAVPPGADPGPAQALLTGFGFAPRSDGYWGVRHVRRTHGRANLVTTR